MSSTQAASQAYRHPIAVTSGPTLDGSAPSGDVVAPGLRGAHRRARLHPRVVPTAQETAHKPRLNVKVRGEPRRRPASSWPSAAAPVRADTESVLSGVEVAARALGRSLPNVNRSSTSPAGGQRAYRLLRAAQPPSRGPRTAKPSGTLQPVKPGGRERHLPHYHARPANQQSPQGVPFGA